MTRWTQVGVGFLAVVCSGCGLSTPERATVGAFAEATSALGEASGEAFVRMRADTIALTGAVLELGNPNGAAVSPSDLDRALDAADVAARVQAARALAEYGRLLSALASGEHESSARASAMSFQGTLDGLTEQGTIDLDEQKRSAIGGVLAEIAGGVIETRNAAAIREMVPVTALVVDRLCDLIVMDFDTSGTGFASQVLIARSDAVSAARVIEVGLPPLSEAPQTAPVRERIAATYALAESAAMRTEGVTELVLASAEALRDAHSNLKTSVDSGGRLTIDRLEALVLRVDEFVTLVEVIADD